MVHVLLLLGCAVLIYLACEWFINAVEWLGARLQVGSTAVGSVLAAVGTALPESVVTLVAVVFGGGHATDDIAVGAALGGPLVVGTIAYGVTGFMLLRRRARRPATGPAAASAAVSSPAGSAQIEGLDAGDIQRLARDQTWFIVIFVVTVALGLVAFTVKPWLGLVFFATYAVYFWREMRADEEKASHEDLAPLTLQLAVRSRRPGPSSCRPWPPSR